MRVRAPGFHKAVESQVPASVIFSHQHRAWPREDRTLARKHATVRLSPPHWRGPNRKTKGNSVDFHRGRAHLRGSMTSTQYHCKTPTPTVAKPRPTCLAHTTNSRRPLRTLPNN